MKFRTSVMLVVLLSVLIGCSSGALKPREEKTQPVAEGSTVNSTETKQVEEIIAQTNLEPATQTAAEKAADEAQKVEAAATRSVQVTRAAAAAGSATAQANGMAGAVTKLKNEGILQSDAGQYYRIEDFDKNWNKLVYYDYWGTGLNPSNFVVRAHTAWEMASSAPDAGGCGFAFRLRNGDNHYMIFLANTGDVWLHMFQDGVYKKIASTYFDNQVGLVKGQADVMLVVEGSKIYYYVNGKKALEAENKAFASGALTLSVISGTDQDYGTHCQMSNIELWDLGD